MTRHRRTQLFRLLCLLTVGTFILYACDINKPLDNANGGATNQVGTTPAPPVLPTTELPPTNPPAQTLQVKDEYSFTDCRESGAFDQYIVMLTPLNGTGPYTIQITDINGSSTGFILTIPQTVTLTSSTIKITISSSEGWIWEKSISYPASCPPSNPDNPSSSEQPAEEPQSTSPKNPDQQPTTPPNQPDPTECPTNNGGNSPPGQCKP